jgi:hypothetical protein
MNEHIGVLSSALSPIRCLRDGVSLRREHQNIHFLILSICAMVKPDAGVIGGGCSELAGRS